MSYKIISKFIKDISFEIPNAQAYVMLEKEIANYALNFDIKSNPYKNKIIEVNTILKIVPNQNVKHKILTEITSTALVTIEGKYEDKRELEKIILVKVPEDMWPTIYETFVFLFTQAGVKNVEIEKNVDFEKMYNERKK